MTTTINVENLSDTSVRLSCTLGASQERVYRAWTTPTEVARWFEPPGARCQVSDMDLRVGGRYCLIIDAPNGRHETSGEYLELEPVTRIAFTWKGTCGGADGGVSRVTVDLSAADGGGTSLTLTHSLLADAASRDMHATGWIGCLGGLQSFTASS